MVGGSNDVYRAMARALRGGGRLSDGRGYRRRKQLTCGRRVERRRAVPVRRLTYGGWWMDGADAGLTCGCGGWIDGLHGDTRGPTAAATGDPGGCAASDALAKRQRQDHVNKVFDKMATNNVVEWG